MAERANIQARLNAGIDAVRSGDLAQARRLLQQVITADPNNELAWMWLASAVTTPAERRACLERALKINPNNVRAQEALRRLETSPAANPRDVVDMRETEMRRQRRIQQQGGGTGRSPLSNPYFIAAALVLVLVLAGVLLLVVNNQGDVTPTPTPVSVVLADTTQDPSAPRPTRPPTSTPLPAVVIPLHEAQGVTPPPTFTPTDTPTATATFTPTVTPLPLANFGILFSAGNIGEQPSMLARIQADGTRELQFSIEGGDIRDIAVDPSGQRVAFVRHSTVGLDEIAIEATEEVDETGLPQLFVAPIDDLNAAIQITRLQNTIMGSPTWSPDGNRIAFTSNADGDEDIYVISRDGGEPTRLTQNPGVDRDPAWAPDGRFIAYASDQDSPAYGSFAGSPEIYLMNVDGSLPQRLTDAAGDSYSPAWSPDSRHIVFVSTRSGDADLYIMDTDGIGENLLTFDDGNATDADPVYLPHGEWIAFISNRDGGNWQIYLVDPAGSTVLPVTDNNLAIQSLAIIP